MPNKSSPHGGFISEGTVSSGTMRTQDLLRAFADEYERVLPFNSRNMCAKARELADKVDAADGDPNDEAIDYVGYMMDALQDIAAREGFYFGAHEGDGSDYGYWATETEDF